MDFQAWQSDLRSDPFLKLYLDHFPHLLNTLIDDLTENGLIINGSLRKKMPSVYFLSQVWTYCPMHKRWLGEAIFLPTGAYCYIGLVDCLLEEKLLKRVQEISDLHGAKLEVFIDLETQSLCASGYLGEGAASKDFSAFQKQICEALSPITLPPN